MAQTLTPEIINAAIEGFEAQKIRIDQQLAELRSMLDGASTAATPAKRGKRRTISAEGRARIAEAQRRRWAASKGESESAAEVASAPPKKKRRLSAAGRKAIQEALRKRWAAKRAEATKTAPTKTKTGGKKASVNRSSAKATKRAPAKKATKITPDGQATTQPAA